MSLDLTAAIEAGAAPIWYESNPDMPIRECDEWDYCKSLARQAIEAARPVIERAVREQAAQELITWADEGAVGIPGTRRRTLHAAARKILPKMTLQEVAEAMARGDYVGCHLDEAGRAIPPAERT